MVEWAERKVERKLTELHFFNQDFDTGFFLTGLGNNGSSSIVYNLRMRLSSGIVVIISVCEAWKMFKARYAGPRPWREIDPSLLIKEAAMISETLPESFPVSDNKAVSLQNFKKFWQTATLFNCEIFWPLSAFSRPDCPKPIDCGPLKR